MTEMNKINVEALENVAGGYETHTVHNDAVSYANCRKEPGLNSKVFFTIPNGTQVYTTGRKVKKDGYVWYEITLAGAYDTGWIAGFHPCGVVREAFNYGFLPLQSYT